MANNVVGVPHPNGSYSFAAGTILQRGAVPTAAQQKGTQFYDTDLNLLYASSGASWAPVDNTSFTTTTYNAAAALTNVGTLRPVVTRF